MKKLITLLSVLVLLFTCSAVFAACDNGGGRAGNDSAYQIWLDSGNTGTEADFLEWLKTALKKPDDKTDDKKTIPGRPTKTKPALPTTRWTTALTA